MLVMNRTRFLTAAMLALIVLAAGQVSQPSSFEVASIKPIDAPPDSSGIATDHGLLRAQNVTLKRCISGAYGVPEAQIIGGGQMDGRSAIRNYRAGRSSGWQQRNDDDAPAVASGSFSARVAPPVAEPVRLYLDGREGRH
jgi:hypothetical protein